MMSITNWLQMALDGDDVPTKNVALLKAADEIERLRSALEYIAKSERWGDVVHAEVAQQALTGREGGKE